MLEMSRNLLRIIRSKLEALVPEEGTPCGTPEEEADKEAEREGLRL